MAKKDAQPSKGRTAGEGAGRRIGGGGSPPRRRKQPQQNRSEITLRNILQATQEMAAMEGFVKITTPRIAKRAGISVGSLYQYFANREAIYLALYENVSSECAIAMRSTMLEIVNEPPKVGVRTMVAKIMQLYEKNSQVLLVMPRDVPELRAHIAGLTSFDGLIRASVKTYLQMHLPPGTKRQVETRLFLLESGIIHTLQRYALERPTLLSREKFLADATDIVVSYLERESRRKS